MKDYRRIARRITTILFLSQSLSSAGFIAAFTVNALVVVDLSGQPAMAGVPGAVYVAGQACSAMVWGSIMERFGRRRVLALGQVIGVVGFATVAGAVVFHSLLFFLAGLVLAGMAKSAVDLSRFAAAEVHLPAERGRAISYVVLGSTVGAVFGPLLVGPTGQLAMGLGYPELAGPYGVGFATLVVAAILIFMGLRPEPRDVGRELARLYPASVPTHETRPLPQIMRQPGVVVAMVAVVFAQMVMMMLMSITSLHMKAHQHPLTSVSMMISAHTLGMYAFSVFTGRMTDKWGRGPVILLGSALMIVACLMAAPSSDLVPLVSALFLLGLGWNCAYVGGSTLLADQLSPRERAKAQGFNDLMLNLGSGGSQIASGLVYAVGGYGVMGLVAAVAALVPLSTALWWQRVGSRRAAGLPV